METKPIDPKPVEPSKPVASWRIPLLVAAFSIIATLVLNKSFEYWTGRMRSLTFQVTSVSGLLNKPDLGGKQLALTVDGQPVDNLSTLTISFYNASDRDYTNVPIVLAFKHKDGKQIKIIRESSSADPGNLEKTLPTTNPDTESLQRTYKLLVANRQTATPILRCDYVFEGTLPEVAVNVLHEGIVAEQNIIGAKSLWATFFESMLTTVAAVLPFALFALIIWLEIIGKKLKKI